MSEKKLCCFGFAANPPTVAHQAIVLALVSSRRFDEVIVYPSGPREECDKQDLGENMLLHRKNMCEMTFPNIPGLRKDYRDLEEGIFTRTVDLDAFLRDDPDVVRVHHVVGADLIQGGAKKESYIHRIWLNGTWLFEHLNFVVIRRQGYAISAEDLPPNSWVYPVKDLTEVSSTEVRRRCAASGLITGLVVREVALYIQSWGLYRKNGGK